MTEHLTPEEQAEVFARHVDALLFGNDDEFLRASMALGATATNHENGWGLCFGLGVVARRLVLKIEECEQQAVTVYDLDQAATPLTVEAVRFFSHALNGDRDAAHELYCAFEELEDPAALALLVGTCLRTTHQLGLQTRQAMIDREATA